MQDSKRALVRSPRGKRIPPCAVPDSEIQYAPHGQWEELDRCRGLAIDETSARKRLTHG